MSCPYCNDQTANDLPIDDVARKLNDVIEASTVGRKQ